jgi:hypothetical protein
VKKIVNTWTRSALGDRYTATASIGAIFSWTRRLSHHWVVPWRAFWCSSTRSPPADTRMELRMRPRQALDEGSRIALLETVTRPQRWLRLLDHGSGDCPTTVWYRSSFLMLSDPLSAHPDACGVSDAPSGVAESARGKRCNGYTMSAEVVASWTRRLHHHRMVIRRCARWPHACPSAVYRSEYHEIAP